MPIIPRPPPRCESRRASGTHLADASNESLIPEQTPSKDEGYQDSPPSPPTRHWKVPSVMVTAFLVGVAISVGHHFYYHHLDGQTVQSAGKQQWALRFGTAFAFLAKCCFCASSQVALTQWLWKTLRHKFVSIQAMDAAFAAHETLLSFFNLEMLCGMKTLTVLALTIWCIPLVALVTPATLTVKTTIRYDVVNASVPVPFIPQYLPYHLSYYDTEPQNNQTFLELNKLVRTYVQKMGETDFDDVSPRFNELALSTATMGQLFPIRRPVPGENSTYSVDFTAPRLLCNESSAEGARDTIIDAFRFTYSSAVDWDPLFPNETKSIDFENLTYYGGAGASDQIGYYGGISCSGDAVDKYAIKDNCYTEGAINEFRVAVASRDPHQRTTSTFLTCLWWNATWTVNVTNTLDHQTVSVDQIQLLNEVRKANYSFQAETRSSEGIITANLNEFFSTALFKGLVKNLLGYVGLYGFQSHAGKVIRTSEIQATVLTASNEYLAMSKSILSEDSSSLQPSNRSLKDMIEEYGQNVTLNLMSDDYFSTQVVRPVTRPRAITVYAYEPRNLAVAYSVAAFSCLLIVCIGMYALDSNGMSYDQSVSTVICTTQNPDIKRLIGNRTTGCQPLPADIAHMKLRFGIVSLEGCGPDSSKSEYIGFGVEGTVSEVPREVNG